MAHDSTPSFASTPFQGHGSIGEAYAIGATPGEHLTLIDGSGSNVGSGVVDSLGGIIIRNLKAGRGYRFEETGGQAPQDRVVRGAVGDARLHRRLCTAGSISMPGSTT